MNPNIVHYTRPFRILIPDGWTFYSDGIRGSSRQYSKGESYQKARIYQRGRIFSIDRLDNYETALLVKLVEDGKIEDCKIILFSGRISYWVYSDYSEKRLIPYKDPDFKKIQAWRINGDDEWLDRYQLHYLHEPLIEIIKDLVANRWIYTWYDKKFD